MGMKRTRRKGEIGSARFKELRLSEALWAVFCDSLQEDKEEGGGEKRRER